MKKKILYLGLECDANKTLCVFFSADFVLRYISTRCFSLILVATVEADQRAVG